MVSLINPLNTTMDDPKNTRYKTKEEQVQQKFSEEYAKGVSGDAFKFHKHERNLTQLKFYFY